MIPRRILGDSARRGVRAIGVDIFAIDVMDIGERTAMLATSVALLQAVEFDL